MKCHRTRRHAHTPNSQSLADTDRLSQSLCIIHRETGQGARFVAVSVTAWPLATAWLGRILWDCRSGTTLLCSTWSSTDVIHQRQRRNVPANDDNSHSVVADQFSNKTFASAIQSLRSNVNNTHFGAFPAFQPLRHSLLLQNHNCYNPLPQYIMSMVHPDRLQRRVCANQKQTVRFLYSPRLSFLLAQVEVTDKCRHKVVDQSLAPSEKAAISTMFSS